jgi:hypothetical protein
VGVENMTDLRDRAKAAMPAEWPRIQKGITGLIAAQRAKMPAGKKAFAAWRKAWAALAEKYPLESLRAE